MSSTSRLPIRGLTAHCLMLGVALAGALPVGAQVTQTFSYTFSSCASGVTMQVTLPVTQTIMAPSGFVQLHRHFGHVHPDHQRFLADL